MYATKDISEENATTTYATDLFALRSDDYEQEEVAMITSADTDNVSALFLLIYNNDS